MKIRDFWLDRNFLMAVWLPIHGCIIHGGIFVIMALVIWGLAGSYSAALVLLESIANEIMRTTLIVTVLLNGVLLIRDIEVIKDDLLSPVVPVTNLKELEDTDGEGAFLFNSLIPLAIVSLIVIFSLTNYLSHGEQGIRAVILQSVLEIIPFPLSFFIALFTFIVIQIIFLGLKYIIQRKSFK